LGNISCSLSICISRAMWRSKSLCFHKSSGSIWFLSNAKLQEPSALLNKTNIISIHSPERMSAAHLQYEQNPTVSTFLRRAMLLVTARSHGAQRGAQLQYVVPLWKSFSPILLYTCFCCRVCSGCAGTGRWPVERLKG
jgi:hypothetical protein